MSASSYVVLQKAKQEVEITSDMFRHCPFPQIILGQLRDPPGRSFFPLWTLRCGSAFLLAKSVLVKRPQQQWSLTCQPEEEFWEVQGAKTGGAETLTALGSPWRGLGFWGCAPHGRQSPEGAILTLMEKDFLVIEPFAVKTISPSHWCRHKQEWDCREGTQTWLVKDH